MKQERNVGAKKGPLPVRDKNLEAETQRSEPGIDRVDPGNADLLPRIKIACQAEFETRPQSDAQQRRCREHILFVPVQSGHLIQR